MWALESLVDGLLAAGFGFLVARAAPRDWLEGPFVAAVIWLAATALGGCGPVQVGPFVPPGAKVCGSDADCGPGTWCQFPKPGSRAVCMPGDNPIDDYPPGMARPRGDGGP